MDDTDETNRVVLKPNASIQRLLPVVLLLVELEPGAVVALAGVNGQLVREVAAREAAGEVAGDPRRRGVATVGRVWRA